LYAWIAENRGASSVALCCAVLEVRREGYYDFLKRTPQEKRDEALLSALKQIRKDNPDYGTKSMIDELPESLKPSYGKGYRVCRDNGLLTRRRRPKSITKADPEAQKAEDLVQRDFTAKVPGIKVFTDITEMKCADGKLYYCGVLDAFDGAQIGYSMAEHMRAELCTAAIMQADRRFGLTKDCIAHSDRGSQFTSRLFRETLSNHGWRQSMGMTGCCYDNARAESFFATLKKELIYKLPLSRLTRAEVRTRIVAWVEGYYNKKRRNTANDGNLAPLVKREHYYEALKAA
jgi:transposase InsO family protein